MKEENRYRLAVTIFVLVLIITSLQKHAARRLTYSMCEPVAVKRIGFTTA